jgi:hypothetical protein
MEGGVSTGVKYTFTPLCITSKNIVCMVIFVDLNLYSCQNLGDFKNCSHLKEKQHFSSTLAEELKTMLMHVQCAEISTLFVHPCTSLHNRICVMILSYYD